MSLLLLSFIKAWCACLSVERPLANYTTLPSNRPHFAPAPTMHCSLPLPAQHYDSICCAARHQHGLCAGLWTLPLVDTDLRKHILVHCSNCSNMGTINYCLKYQCIHRTAIVPRVIHCTAICVGLSSDGARCLEVGVHENPDLPEAFHERRMHEFANLD